MSRECCMHMGKGLHEAKDHSGVLVRCGVRNLIMMQSLLSNIPNTTAVRSLQQTGLEACSCRLVCLNS